jgi:hypothetical protein
LSGRIKSEAHQKLTLFMAALVAAIPVSETAPFPIEMAGESSPHAAGVFLAKDGRAKRALWPAMT